MFEKTLDVKTDDGIADCEFYAPAETGSWPGIIMYPDILGIRPVFRDMARRLAEAGFCVLLPNVYYRVSKMPVFDFTPAFGEEKTVARIAELRPSAAPALFARDARFYVDGLAAQEQCNGKIGVVGYCMGGAMAVRTAAAAPGKVAAAASFHGGQLASDAADSPHLLLSEMKARLYFGFATEDKSMPPEMIEKLKAALKDSGREWSSDIYEGARHGWCVQDHNVYNAPQAERAWSAFVTLLSETLI